MKRIIIYLLTLSVLASLAVNASAYAVREPRDNGTGMKKGADDIFFEDFTSYEVGELPKNMSVTQNANNIIEIAEAETPDSESKNVLKITDTATSGAGTIKIPVPASKNPITFEIRIKHKKTTTPGYGFIMDFRDESLTNAFRIIRYNVDNGAYTYVSSNGNDKALTSNNNTLTHDDTWFTIKVRIDSDMKQTGVIIENEQITSDASLTSAKYSNVWPDPENNRVMGYKLTWVSEEIESISQIVLQPYGASMGEHFIDYIKFTENVPEFLPVRKRAESKEIQIISDPVQQLYPDKINVMFRGEVKYCTNPVLIVESRAMADADAFAEWYGIELVGADGGYELKYGENTLRFTVDNPQFELNGKALTADVAPRITDNCLYIPVKSFANALGSSVSWSSDPRCVTIE